MTTATRIYVVGHKTDITQTRLVRAANPSQAIRHVAKDTYSAASASQDDLVGFLTQGVAIETAGEDPA